MKATAYIAILLSLLTLWTPVEAARVRSAERLKGSIQVGPVRSKRGKAYNPRLRRFDAETQLKMGSQQVLSSENNLSSESLQSTSNGGGSGVANNGANRNNVGVGNNSTQNGKKPEGQDSPLRNMPEDKQGSRQGSGSEGVSFRLWWPVCVFVDGPDANSQIAEMVRMSAACRVNLKPYIRTVSVPDPNNPEQLNSLQRQSCNIKEGGIAGKGSSLVLTNRSSTVADEMCGSKETVNGVTRPTKRVEGCNELANGASRESIDRASRPAAGHGSLKVSNGEVAVGIVDSQGYSSGAVYSHETMGHGQMGWPNGKKAGNGIGDPNDAQDSGGGHQHGGWYEEIGCAQMRASAIPDPEGYHKFYSSKTKYYSHREDKKMPLGEKIWKTFKEGPQIAGQITRRGPRSSRGTESAASSQGSNLGSASAGHKKARGGSRKASGGSLAGGKTGKRDSGGAIRGDGSDDDSLASQVSGGSSGGAGDPNFTIVANKAKSALAEKPGVQSPVLETNYFESNSSGSNLGGASTGSPSSIERRELASADFFGRGNTEST
ncbi:MAG: hypothetical protein FJ116_11200, partial [Deltaproteobacteria bacterium]|nr:hypothetical protein [Deltaproteobacteria bacterium]